MSLNMNQTDEPKSALGTFLGFSYSFYDSDFTYTFGLFLNAYNRTFKLSSKTRSLT